MASKRRGVLVGLRYRLGGRPLLYRLCAADQRIDHHRIRRQAGRHTRRRAHFGRSSPKHGVSALFTAPTAFAPSARKIRGEVCSPISDADAPGAVSRRRARRSRNIKWAERHLRRSRHRSLVADGNRLGDRRQSFGLDLLPVKHGSRPADAGYQVDVLDDAGHPVADGVLGNIVIKLPLPPAALPRSGTPTSVSAKAASKSFRVLQDGRRRLSRRGRLSFHHGPHRRHHQLRGPPPVDWADGGGLRDASGCRRMRRDRRRRRTQGADPLRLPGAQEQCFT